MFDFLLDPSHAVLAITPPGEADIGSPGDNPPPDPTKPPPAPKPAPETK